MLVGDQGRVADPSTYDVQRVHESQFRFPASPDVLKQLRPRREAGTANDPAKLRPKIGVRVTVSERE